MKKAIIIGASSGIGKSLSEVLIQNNYSVGITGRRIELLKSIQGQYPDQIYYTKLDVQDVSSINTACHELTTKLGGLDLLIISAGIGEINKKLDFSIDKDVLLTNVTGFTAVANWAMNYFKSQGSGHLVNISSIAGLRGNGDAPSYNATKSFQVNYFEGLRLNAYKSGNPIYVTDVRPGFVDTAMAKGDGLFWVAPVEKAALQIYSAIKRKKKVIYITRRWRIIALLLRLLPFSILKKL